MKFKKKSSPVKLQSQSQPNFAEMILGWSSSKYVSGISELRPRCDHLGYRTVLTDTILKGTHPGTIPARFGLIWFSGFRGEDLKK
jgi:hypothetical protein